MNIYSMDVMEVINESRKLAKKIKKQTSVFDIKIGVLGSVSTQYFVMVLRFLLYKEGIYADIYEGEYNGIMMDVLNSNSSLYSFKPEIVILITHYLDIKRFPLLLDSDNEIDKLEKESLNYYENLWNKLNKISKVQIFQSNFVSPPEHILGNLETKLRYSKTSFYKELNKKLVEKAPANVTIVDVDLLSNYIGKYNWFDYSAYFLNKSVCSIKYFPDLADLFKRQIMALKGRTKKCLILDLDNTLWGGVVGDEGYNGIQLDPNNAVGEAFRYFQMYLLELKKRGVILAICSKNDEKNAKEPFEKNPNMILHLDDISCFIANWEDKASNIRKIAQELNIGVNSLVFFDDNPAEREIVQTFVPECHVINVPADPAEFVIQLDKESVFEWVQITKEDLLRSNSYIENRNRVNLETQFVNYNSYLEALEMEGIAEKLTASDVPRFTQLLNKSNQFNLRTQRYTESDIYKIINSDNGMCIYVNLKDKFSEYGLISCVILKRIANQCFIESWVMSCRVLKRNVEGFMFQCIIEKAKEMNCVELIGEYVPSAKNNMVLNFYDSLGFKLLSTKAGIKTYAFSLLSDIKVSKNFIKRIE